MHFISPFFVSYQSFRTMRDQVLDLQLTSSCRVIHSSFTGTINFHGLSIQPNTYVHYEFLYIDGTLKEVVTPDFTDRSCFFVIETPMDHSHFIRFQKHVFQQYRVFHFGQLSGHAMGKSDVFLTIKRLFAKAALNGQADFSIDENGIVTDHIEKIQFKLIACDSGCYFFVPNWGEKTDNFLSMAAVSQSPGFQKSMKTIASILKNYRLQLLFQVV